MFKRNKECFLLYNRLKLTEVINLLSKSVAENISLGNWVFFYYFFRRLILAEGKFSPVFNSTFFSEFKQINIAAVEIHNDQEKITIISSFVYLGTSKDYHSVIAQVLRVQFLNAFFLFLLWR